MSTDDLTRTPDRSHGQLSKPERERLRDLVHGSMSAEFASRREGKPSTFPLTPFYDELRGTVVLSSPVAYAGKASAVERDPRVSLLLRDADGEYLVTGDARVNDDLEANAAYVRELNEREPATPKRAANEEKYEFVESRLGNALVGWLGHRVLIEIEPVSMTPIADRAPKPELSAWPAVGMDRDEAAKYDRAVLTVVGDDGYPKTQPLSTVKIRDGAAVLDPEPTEPPADGQPACLLFHWHDDASIHIGQRVVRGRFRTNDGSLRFDPGSSTTLHNDGITDTLHFLVDGKRRTRAYFAARDGTPPGPDGWPLLGNTVQFLRDPRGFYETLPEYGDVVRYRIGGNTWTALLHPDAVERVLVSDSHRFRRYNFEEFGFDFITEGLFFAEGEQWRRQRQVIQPAFAPAKIAPFSETVVERALETVDRWDDGETIVAEHVFSDFTLEILTATLFDLDLEDRRDVVTDAARALAERVDTRSLSAVLPGWVPTSRNRRFDRTMARFDALVETLIDERRGDDRPRDDLLSTLLELSDPESGASTVETDATGADYSFTDEELRDQLVTFLFAGHETSALAFTYVFHQLAKHDDVRRTLHEELDAVCGDRHPTYEDVPDLEYTESVIKETMRYYPPVYVLFREALEDVTIDDDLIPEGTKLALPQFVLHRDDRWWDDPHEFRPERWLDDENEQLPEYAYFPFGGGPRHCVGMRFAMMLLIVGVATISRLVRFDLESDPDPELRMAATLSPATDVELRVRKRE